ncbi:MAG: 16S rRNA (guanine(527)-N(7))-methyltransferase RsmG [Clostridia bacterium]|nr:16S rRNA (guanine(527)-N(7))-methyltransferase RsmG [Clostridia bacterium]
MSRDLLKEHLENIGLLPDNNQLNQFLKFEEMLVEYNKVMNLTGITESEEIYDKHFADSLTCLLSNIFKPHDKVIDVGTGAGFPGMPMKIYMPSLHITLLDSLNKRIEFLKAVGSALNLNDIEYIHGRAEDYGQDENYREQFDVCVSRAVADLPVLLEYCTPFIKVGGFFIAQKGSKVEEELQGSQSALLALNLVVHDIIDVRTSDATNNHKLLIIKKVDQTDQKYPRRAGKPLKKPL